MTNLDLGQIVPRYYQQEAHDATVHHIRTSSKPAFIDASVGAGKTILIAMICKQAQLRNMSVLVLARQGELVEQNAQEMWNVGARNSIYSASLGRKSKHYPIIAGTEGTVCRSLNSDFSDVRPDILLIDEAHQVNFEDSECQYMQIITEMYRRNPKLRIIGYTGSPFRGTESILGDFWDKCLYQISTEQLVEEGFLVPTVFGFGHDDVQYDLSEFKTKSEHGTSDFTSKELQSMQRGILKDPTKTQLIMAEVQEITKDRNGVLITCAGKKHCEEVAKSLPDGTWGIITDSTSTKERRRILKAAYLGKIKYVIQVGALTTGVNIPLWDTSVLLRRIASLTLLIQLLGRGMRTLKPEHEDLGFTKSDHLVLDYSDTLHEMAELYHNPILERAEAARAKERKEEKICPKCDAMNSNHARRCIGEVAGERCDFFWSSIECKECGTENDVVARECRNCGKQLKDPNENLSVKHYKDSELTRVVSMQLKEAKNGALVVAYKLEDGREPVQFFRPDGGNNAIVNKRIWFNGFVKYHVGGQEMQMRVRNMSSVDKIVKMQAMFDVPTMISCRYNEEKGRWNIGRRVFNSGREVGEVASE